VLNHEIGRSLVTKDDACRIYAAYESIKNASHKYFSTQKHRAVLLIKA